MKIENYKEVSALIENLNKVTEVLEEVTYILTDEKDQLQEDSYYGHIAKYKDGSGSLLNLTGCYILPALMSATRNVLEIKKEEVLLSLKELGVEI